MKSPELTPRELVSMGLSAGLGYSETLRVTPGEVIDFYLMRRAYDDEQHGIKRE